MRFCIDISWMCSILANMRQTDTKEAYINQITEICGVSRSTIFRFMAGEQVRESSRKKITEAMASLDGKNEGAEDSPLKEIAVSINSPDFDIFKGNSEALSGILEQATTLGIPVRLERDLSPEKREGVGVVIVGKHGSVLMDECTLLKSQQVPFVVVNRMIADRNVSYAAVDNVACGRDMADHLISEGYKRIAFWGEQTTMVSRAKLEGYKEALSEHGIPYDPDLVVTDVDAHPLPEAFSSFMALPSKPDAFMTMDDETALKVIRIAVTNGISVPGDLAVSGMNDIDASKNVMPSISSISISFRKLGAYAVDILVDLAKEPDKLSEKVVINHRLMIRDSTKRG
jgi:DNA-binding LacI/PurR family transcriptional regulator